MIKRSIALFLSLVILLFSYPTSVSAAVAERLQYDNIYYISPWEEYELSTNLESSGRFEMTINGQSKAVVYDSKYNEVANAVVKVGDPTLYWNVDVVSGTYKIVITTFDDSCTFLAYFKSVPETVSTESLDNKNNVEELADSIKLGKKVEGHIAHNDDRDIYKVTLKKKGNLKIKIDSKIESKGIKIHIFQKNGKNSKFSKALKKGKNTVTFKGLKKGTWYISIEAQNGEKTINDVYTGTYTFTAKQ